jgi:hypothetical protein
MTGVVRGDSSYRGYFFPLQASDLQVAGTGGVRESRGVVHFFAFPSRYALLANDSTTTTIQSVDSIRLNLSLRHRTAGTVQLAVYRLPKATDTLISYDSATTFFQDSLKVADVPLTVDTGLVQVVIPPSALPTLEADSFEVVLGFALASPDTANVLLGSNEAGFGSFLERFIQVDSGPAPATRIKRTDTRLAQWDTFVFRDLVAPPAGALAVGGSPSARALMRLTLPPSILDSTYVVRATLLLIPATPAQSAAGDTMRVLAHALSTDIGPKSPVDFQSIDNDVRAGAYVPPGSSDTIRVDITNILRIWRADSTLPRTLVLRTVPEAGTLSEIRFWQSSDAARQPRIHLTFVRPFQFGVR